MSEPFDPRRVAFVQGALAALAATGQLIQFNELRRLCGCTVSELAAALDAARAPLREARVPDVCAIIVSEDGTPSGFRDLEDWSEELARAHAYWQERRMLDDDEFTREHRLPGVPGAP